MQCVCLEVTNHTLKLLLDHFKTHVIKSQIFLIHCYAENQPSIYLLMHDNTCFDICLYSVLNHHGNLLNRLWQGE